MKKITLVVAALLSVLSSSAKNGTDPVDYVNPLVGSQSKVSLSTGNTYPAIALPWLVLYNMIVCFTPLH